MLPSTYTLSPFLQYFSAMSASPEPLLFQRMTRCHSVFSCFSPDWFFHWRLVASARVATRGPLEVLRPSGSAPRSPIRLTLLRLRLPCPSGVEAGGHRLWTPVKCTPAAGLPQSDRCSRDHRYAGWLNCSRSTSASSFGLR